MPVPTCTKCEGHTFQAVEQSLVGAADKILFVQCGVCGTAVGVLDVHDNAALLKQQAAAIEELKAQVSQIDAGLRRIVEYLQNA